MIEPEDDCCFNADGVHEAMSATLVAGLDTASVLDFAEEFFNLVALTRSAAHIIGDRTCRKDLMPRHVMK